VTRWITLLGAGVIISFAASSNAQTSQSGYRTYRATAGPNHTIPCSGLPAGAVKAVPAPFDRYMQFECNALTGQGLRSVDGFHWMNDDGMGMGLSATSTAGGPDAKGQMHFPFSWYAQLDPIPLTAAQQQVMRKEFEQAVLPRFLTGATILELKAMTSNAEEKRIYLIVPDTKPGLPKWLVGLECNGACFREDPQPMRFLGEPNG